MDQENDIESAYLHKLESLKYTPRSTQGLGAGNQGVIR